MVVTRKETEADTDTTGDVIARGLATAKLPATRTAAANSINRKG